MKKLLKNIYFHVTSEGTNLGCVLGEDGVACIDLPLDPGEARAWRAQIAEFSDKPIRAVLFTSSERLTSEALAAVGAPAMLHDSAFAQVAAPAEPAPAPLLEPVAIPLIRDLGQTPHVTFSQSASLVLGIKQTMVVDIVHQGGCAPDACFVIPRGTGIAFVGDHVAAGSPPAIAQGNFERWQTVLAALKKNKSISMIVPGRGAPGVPGPMIDQTLDYIRVATTRVRALVRANRSRSDVVAMIPDLLARYGSKGSRTRSSSNLDSAYRQVRAGLERIYDDLKAGPISV
jgi:hypothetical protein